MATNTALPAVPAATPKAAPLPSQSYMIRVTYKNLTPAQIAALPGAVQISADVLAGLSKDPGASVLPIPVVSASGRL